jgi:YgiT-type zinc finger domain-containing protein
MSCEFCRIGHYEDVVVPYIQWVNGQIMVIPNAPAYSCDICGYMEYDVHFMQKLNQLLANLTDEENVSAATYQRPMIVNSTITAATRRSQ